MVFSTVNLLALAGLLFLFLLSLRWVFGAPKPKRVPPKQSHDPR